MPHQTPATSASSSRHRQVGRHLGCFGWRGAPSPAGRRYCPHGLNPASGLHAAAHVLSAAGGDGLLEHDAMENRCRRCSPKTFPPLVDGLFTLTDGRASCCARPCAAKPFLVHRSEHRM